MVVCNSFDINMNCAKSCENLLNFVKVMPKILSVLFFSGHGLYVHYVADSKQMSTFDQFRFSFVFLGLPKIGRNRYT